MINHLKLLWITWSIISKYRLLLIRSILLISKNTKQYRYRINISPITKLYMVDLLCLLKYFSYLKLRGRYSQFKIIFGGVIIVLANKSITTHNFTLLSVWVMISSLNDYWKPLLNRVWSLSLSKIITHAVKWPTLLFIKEVNSQPSPANFGY